MAYSAITSAVNKAISEAKIQVIDEFIKLLDTKIEIDDDLKATFDEFKKTLEKTIATKGTKASKEPKKKRSATLFNLFVKNKQAELKAEHPEENGKAIIGMASKAWKEDPFAVFIKEHAEKLKNDNAESDNETLYNMLKEMYESDAESKPTKKKTVDSDSEESEVPKKGAKSDSENSDDDKPPVKKTGGKGKGKGKK